jgi:hypothetical protein
LAPRLTNSQEATIATIVLFRLSQAIIPGKLFLADYSGLITLDRLFLTDHHHYQLTILGRLLSAVHSRRIILG